MNKDYLLLNSEFKALILQKSILEARLLEVNNRLRFLEGDLV